MSTAQAHANEKSLLGAVIGRLERVSSPDSGGWHTALCPFHKDEHHPNLRLRETGFRCMACGEKGSLSKLARKLGIEQEGNRSSGRRVAATYDYQDEDSILLFQVVRYVPKSFKQRRPDGRGGWIWSLEDVRRVLYCLPELLASPTEVFVFYPEGEKDVVALRSLGLCATCNPGGTGKFTGEMLELLRGRHVIVIADKDDTGREHARKLAGMLLKIVASVRVIELPGEGVKDAADWVASGGTADELLRLAEAASTWCPPSGAAVLDEVVAFIRRFVVLSTQQAHAISLWVFHSHAIDSADATPYLSITSPEKRSGKTRLLEALELLVARPWFTGRVTAAVLARKIDAEHPTLLLDESDAAFKGEKEYAETLRSLLNTGYRRDGRASVCVGQGASIGYKDLSTFCPKAIAGIGKLPDTVADRSIPISLKRRSQGECVERFRRRLVEAEASRLRNRVAECAAAVDLGCTDPDIPAELDDRAADCWEPLLVIADSAGVEWPQRARTAAIQLMAGEEREDNSLGIRLLRDIQTVFGGDLDQVSSADLVSELVAMEDAPWGDIRGKALDTRRLSSMLRSYGIRPQTVRIGDRTPRGYRCIDFLDAWGRYLPPVSGRLSATSKTSGTVQAWNTIRNTERDAERDVADRSQAQAEANVADVLDRTGETGDMTESRDAGGSEMWEEVL